MLCKTVYKGENGLLLVKQQTLAFSNLFERRHLMQLFFRGLTAPDVASSSLIAEHSDLQCLLYCSSCLVSSLLAFTFRCFSSWMLSIAVFFKNTLFVQLSVAQERLSQCECLNRECVV